MIVILIFCTYGGVKKKSGHRKMVSQSNGDGLKLKLKISKNTKEGAKTLVNQSQIPRPQSNQSRTQSP